MGIGAVVATSAVASVMDPTAAHAAPTTWTESVGRFESAYEIWSLNRGAEYGGADATFERVTDVVDVGTHSGRLTADFTATGRYAGLVRNLDKLDVTKVRLRIRSDGVRQIAVRLVSGTNTLHMAYGTIPAGGGFQTLEVTGFNGGPTTGVIRMEIQVWKDRLLSGRTAGTIWVDQVEVEHTVDLGTLALLETSGPPVVLSSDEDVLPLVVKATFEDERVRDVTQHATLTSDTPATVEIDQYGYLTVVGAGTASIAVTFEGTSQEFEIEVRDPQVLAPATLVDGRLVADGAEIGFVGYNYDLFMLSFQQRNDWAAMDRDIATMAAWGLSALRLPTSFGLIQPAPGVFPGSDEWVAEYSSRKMNIRYFEMLEYFIERAGKHGIRVVIDWHRHPRDPYDYWHGGNNHDRGTGKPGVGIAWLAPDEYTTVDLDVSNPVHLKAITDTNTWIANHFRGNPNVLGIEVPYNEPHDAWTSIPSNWRKVLEKTAAAVKAGDPDRLTFAMAPAYGHDVASGPATWQLPTGVDGNAPHHYMSNAPIPVRDDAASLPAPWLARDIDAVFSHSVAALFAPYSTSPGPVYNGEGGSYGSNSFLPHLSASDAGDLMIEAGLVQYYAAGGVGQMHWGMWNNAGEFQPYVESFATQFPRFSPVYQAGPVDWSGARVAVIQNPAAVPISNGHNWSVVPWVKIALDVHLETYHLLTDDEIIDRLITQVPSGLEQVEGFSADFDYDAVVVDRRNLDARVLQILDRDDFEIPILWIDDMADLQADQLASFLTDAGVRVDTRTEAGLQLVQGPEHLVVYRRYGNENRRSPIRPRIRRDGSFRLVDEAGEVLYTGTAQQLERRGLPVKVATWRSLILRIEQD